MASSLPFHQRHVNISAGPSSRRGLFRMREKYVILLAIVVILCVCYSGYIFLPDGPEPAGQFMKKALKDAWHANPKDLVVPPPRQRLKDGEDDAGGNKILVHEEEKDADPHLLEDRKRFMQKINEDPQIPRPLQETEQRRVFEDAPKRSNVSVPMVNDEQTERRRETVKQVRCCCCFFSSVCCNFCKRWF
jgi:hypothetical protein